MFVLSVSLGVLMLTITSGYGNVWWNYSDPPTVNDFDGNVYHIITIGTQVWMVENLKTTHYRNGESIPNITGNKAWSKMTSGAYCNYNNDVKNTDAYGRLYNWYAVSDKRNICPAGWHVPADAEWQTLIDYLGGEFVAGGKLKETGLAHWESPNLEATNTSGFSAFAAGSRDNGNGSYGNLGTYTYFWSSTESNGSAWGHNLSFYYVGIGRFEFDKTFGISVRCIKDK